MSKYGELYFERNFSVYSFKDTKKLTKKVLSFLLNSKEFTDSELNTSKEKLVPIFLNLSGRANEEDSFCDISGAFFVKNDVISENRIFSGTIEFEGNETKIQLTISRMINNKAVNVQYREVFKLNNDGFWSRTTSYDNMTSSTDIISINNEITEEFINGLVRK